MLLVRYAFLVLCNFFHVSIHAKEMTPPIGNRIPAVPFNLIQPLQQGGAQDLVSLKHSLLCLNPATILCDSHYSGLALAAEENARTHYHRILLQARSNADFLQFLKAQKVAFCSQITDTQQKSACYAVLRKAQAGLLFTPPRLEKVQSLFQEAQNDALSYLQQRLAAWTPKMGAKRKEGLTEAQNILKKTKLIFDTSVPAQLLDFNVSHRATDNSVFVTGMVLLVEYSQRSLYSRLVREMTHLISPCHWEKTGSDSKFVGHPFSKEQLCLRRQDSAGVHALGTDCFNEVLKTARESGRPIPADLAMVEGQMKTKSNHCPARVFPSEWDPQLRKAFGPVGCFQPQSAEVFADWLTAEILANKLSPLNPDLRKIDPNRQAVAYTKAFLATETWKELSSELAWMCENYIPSYSESDRWKRRNSFPEPNLRAEDRINSVYFAHPRVKENLGCGQEYIGIPPNKRNLASGPWYDLAPTKKDFKMDAKHFGLPIYCGEYLYLRDET